MTKPQFDAAVDQLLVRFGGSVTSGRRTPARSIAVGGFAGDPHTWGLGADVVWDPGMTVEQRRKADDHAAYLGLILLDEGTHTHIQPRDFPAGPVTHYGGVTRSLPGHD